MAIPNRRQTPRKGDRVLLRPEPWRQRPAVMADASRWTWRTGTVLGIAGHWVLVEIKSTDDNFAVARIYWPLDSLTVTTEELDPREREED